MNFYLGGIYEYCPLCLIFNFKSREDHPCIGCPNNLFGINRCLDSLTYGRLIFSVSIDKLPTPGKTHPRYLFWKEALPIIEKLPSKAFTVHGYKDEYFEFLKEIDERIYNKYYHDINKETS